MRVDEARGNSQARAVDNFGVRGVDVFCDFRDFVVFDKNVRHVRLAAAAVNDSTVFE